MKNHEMQRVGKYTIKKVEPKESVKRKPLKQKKNDAIELFYRIGIPDPEGFYNDFQATQKLENMNQYYENEE